MTTRILPFFVCFRMRRFYVDNNILVYTNLRRDTGVRLCVFGRNFILRIFHFPSTRVGSSIITSYFWRLPRCFLLPSLSSHYNKLKCLLIVCKEGVVLENLLFCPRTVYHNCENYSGIIKDTRWQGQGELWLSRGIWNYQSFCHKVIQVWSCILIKYVNFVKEKIYLAAFILFDALCTKDFAMNLLLCGGTLLTKKSWSN